MPKCIRCRLNLEIEEVDADRKCKICGSSIYYTPSEARELLRSMLTIDEQIADNEGTKGEVKP